MRINQDNILKICFKKLKYFKYSEHTVKIYVHYLDEFLKLTNKNYQHLTSNDFQSYLDNYKFKSISQQNQIISSIKLLYEKVLNKKYNKIDFRRPRKERKLPQIIDKEVLRNKILGIKNKKHKAILSLAYSCGLRVSEVIGLKIKDIDSDRMILNIRQVKGNKDRIVPLSDNLLKILREYYIEYRPTTYLFNGQFKLKYSSTSCNKIIKKYISNKAHMHQLKHSCFTAMLESGTDLRIIQKIAGHMSSKTTEIYTHVSTELLSNVITPI